jgi:hypothetical protein
MAKETPVADFVGTTTEFAELIGTEYAVASGVLRYLKEKGIATDGGQRPAKGGKGKPSILFKVPKTVTLKFGS